MKENGKKLWRKCHFSQVSCSEKIAQEFTSNIIRHSQAKTENMTYPWPNVSLVALREKQENNNCQHLLATSNTHRREAVTDRLKN